MRKPFLAILPIFLISFSSSVSSQPAGKKICQTKECLSAAKNFKESMNLDVSPCDDFYKYACGNWPKNHENASSDTQSTITLRVEENKAELLDYLKQNNSGNEPVAVHKARKFLTSCLNDADFGNKLELIETTLQKIGLPSLALLANETENFDYSSALAKAGRLVGINLYFELDVEPDIFDFEPVNKITLKRPTQFRIRNMTEQNYISKVMQNICRNNTATSCAQWISPLNSTTDSTIIGNILNYTKQIGEIVDRSSYFSETYTLQELQNITDKIANEANTTIPKLNWTRYFEETFSGLENLKLNFSDPSKFEIVVEGTTFIERILEFIHKSQNTKVIEHALWWKVVSELFPYIDTEMFDIVNGAKTRQQNCEQLATGYFGFASSYLYATKDKYVEAKTEISTMVQHIRESFQQIIQEAVWMDETTRTKALHKLQTMKSHIVYPAIVSTSSILNDKYREVQLSDNFYDMMTSTIQNEITNKLNTTFQLYDPTKNIKKPTIVNAFYNPLENAMIIPAAIVGTQSIYYNNNLRALSYGGIGSIVGHEMTHGFDNNGRNYNAEGKEEDWWDPQTENMYREKARCFVQAYGNYKANYTGLERLKKNSTATLGEDISDNTGFKESLLAYKKCTNLTGEEPLLPEFENFTHEQLLTIAFGNLWCGNKEAAAGSRYDEHSPSVIRVNGVLRNSKEFAEIWNCPKGSNMNPNKDKCSIW